MHGTPADVLGMLRAMQKGGWTTDDMKAAFGQKQTAGEAATSDQRQTKTNSLTIAQRKEIFNGNHCKD